MHMYDLQYLPRFFSKFEIVTVLYTVKLILVSGMDFLSFVEGSVKFL